MEFVAYKKKILFFLTGIAVISSLIYFSSCTRAKICCAMPANPIFMVYVRDSQSQDLLNPQTKDAYNPQNIQVYYLENNNPTLAYFGNLDHPAMWSMIKDSLSGKYYLSVTADKHLNAQKQTTSFIHWSSTDIDTIICQFEGDGYNPIQKIWCDGNMVWDGYKPEDTVNIKGLSIRLPMFTLVK